jgi:4-amino-4-deoxy-L-arabinose transferase-like glycosyltransferase
VTLRALAGPFQRALIGTAVALLFALGLGRALWTPDEPREAELSREMYLHPTVVPTLDGQRFYEKPPLYYWTVASLFALASRPSIALARSVSGAAGLLTVALVFLWGRRAASVEVGAAAALMIATSVTFAMATHWVLIDPLLMLFCTVAIVSGWELLEGGAGRWAWSLYGALALALWTKGLIGPVLVIGGLAVFSWLERRDGSWRRLRPFRGLAAMAAALGSLSVAVYADGGAKALYEWGWVNHVLRFVHPEGTFHDQPFHYYLGRLPVAALPWLVPLVDLLYRSFWRRRDASSRLRRYAGCLVATGFVVLSLSATKREIYLLPLLPPLFLLLGLAVTDRFERSAAGAARAGDRGLEWLQAGLLGLVALVPGAAVLVYLRRFEPMAVAILVAAVAITTILLLATARRQHERGAVAMIAAAVLFVAGGLTLAPRALDPTKDLAPFVREVDRALPPGEPVTAIGADETLLGIVPFLTGRRVIQLPTEGLDGATRSGPLPDHVLLQRQRGRPQFVPDLSDNYERIQSFGTGRELSLWRRTTP